MTLTEKVKADMGGMVFKVFEVATLTGDGVYSITADDLEMNEIVHANFTWTTWTMTAGATTLPGLITPTTSGGINLAFSGLIASTAADGGLLEVWGH
jgi:hypothetical protein